jgi:hypothetical protein
MAGARFLPMRHTFAVADFANAERTGNADAHGSPSNGEARGV